MGMAVGGYLLGNRTVLVNVDYPDWIFPSNCPARDLLAYRGSSNPGGIS